MNASTTGFGSQDSLKTQQPCAAVGAIGSGENDVQMLQKANIAFSTSIQSTDGAQ